MIADQYFGIAGFALILGIYFWRTATVKFIIHTDMDGDRSRAVWEAFLILEFVLDFVTALARSSRTHHRPPIGVYLHGFLLFVFVVFLVAGIKSR